MTSGKNNTLQMNIIVGVASNHKSVFNLYFFSLPDAKCETMNLTQLGFVEEVSTGSYYEDCYWLYPASPYWYQAYTTALQRLSSFS